MYKKCTKCEKEYSASKEFFYVSAKGKFGLASVCKVCHSKLYGEVSRKRAIKHYYENREEKLEYVKRWAAENSKRVQEYQSNYRDLNKEVTQKYNKAYRLENRDKLLELDRQKYQRNKKEISEYQKNNRPLFNRRMKEYYAKNKGKFGIYAQRRLAKKKDVESDYSLEEWESCKLHFKNCCAYCGKKRKLTQDHFVPLSGGGEYTKNNIIPACRSCNSSKHTKGFFEWYPEQETYSKEREKKIKQYLNYKTEDVQQLALII